MNMWILSLGLVGMLALSGCAHVPPANLTNSENAGKHALVLTTDFGVKDGAVSAMRGVAYSVDPNLVVSDLTHEIPPFDIWQAAYRLKQTSPYWVPGTVFVTVVDPGVGSNRKSVVARTKEGRIFVGPDNGLLTLVEEEQGPLTVYQIDESRQRLKGSEESYTFHGRDLYVYVGARLAAGLLKIEDVGPAMSGRLQHLNYQKPLLEKGVLKGAIPILDTNYGNVWTNLPKNLVAKTFPKAKSLNVKIANQGKVQFAGRVPVAETFAAVAKGQPLLYFNSLLDLAVALNQGSFAEKYHVVGGPGWTVEVSE